MLKGRIKYLLVHSLILLFSLIIFTFLKSSKHDITKKYKPDLDCVSINGLFDVKDDLTSNVAFYEKYRESAKYDKSDTEVGHGLGFYQCFCTTFSKDSKAFKEKQ